MSRYRLYVDAGRAADARTEHVVKGRSPAKALRELCALAGVELASQDGRYGRLADGRPVSAMTEPWGRRRLDPMERQTRFR